MISINPIWFLANDEKFPNYQVKFVKIVKLRGHPKSTFAQRGGKGSLKKLTKGGGVAQNERSLYAFFNFHLNAIRMYTNNSIDILCCSQLFQCKVDSAEITVPGKNSSVTIAYFHIL